MTKICFSTKRRRETRREAHLPCESGPSTDIDATLAQEQTDMQRTVAGKCRLGAGAPGAQPHPGLILSPLPFSGELLAGPRGLPWWCLAQSWHVGWHLPFVRKRIFVTFSTVFVYMSCKIIIFQYKWKSVKVITYMCKSCLVSSFFGS